MDARDKAVVTFAGSLLKRALSESFAGVPMQEGEPQPFFDASDIHQRHKLALAVRSLSLELARQKNKRQSSVSSKRSNNTLSFIFNY
jgi:poly(ADP-ribose) glycohydrolase